MRLFGKILGMSNFRGFQRYPNVGQCNVYYQVFAYKFILHHDLIIICTKDAASTFANCLLVSYVNMEVVRVVVTPNRVSDRIQRASKKFVD